MSAYNMLISRKKLEYIAHNVVLTSHAKERILSRLGDDVNITQLILNSPFWFRDNNGFIIVALNQKKCFIIAEEENCYKLITIDDDSKNNYDIMDKFVLAYSGSAR